MAQDTRSICENQLYLIYWQQIFRKWKYNAIANWILQNIWNYSGINLTNGVCKLFTLKAINIAENNQSRPQCLKMKKKKQVMVYIYNRILNSRKKEYISATCHSSRHKFKEARH